MAVIAGKRRPNKSVDKQERLINTVLPGANRTHVGVVVLPSQHRRVHTPHQSRSNTRHFIGSHLFAIARPAKHHAESFYTSGNIVRHGQSGSDTETGVIIKRVMGAGTVVNHSVPGQLQMLRQIAAEL